MRGNVVKEIFHGKAKNLSIPLRFSEYEKRMKKGFFLACFALILAVFASRIASYDEAAVHAAPLSWSVPVEVDPLPQPDASPLLAQEQVGPEPSEQEEAPPPELPPQEKAREPFLLSDPAPEGARPVRLALIIDDMGQGELEAVFAAVPAEVTLSFLPYASNLAEKVRRAQERGHEIMLHVPMEPLGGRNPGPDALMTSLSFEENAARLEKALGRFTGYVGVNNHMGSKFTQDRAQMERVLRVLRDRGLYFVDSRTDPDSLAGTVAREMGLRVSWRDVFLDDSDSEPAIRAALAQSEKIAEIKGIAVAIGHPRPATLAVLSTWIPEALARGVQIVPISEIAE